MKKLIIYTYVSLTQQYIQRKSVLLTIYHTRTNAERLLNELAF